jgi:glycosyltransferase involved in cell wall biosynthesis
VPQKKVHLIPNMADCNFYFPEKRNPALEEKYKVTGKFVISYIGAVGLANGLDYFLECANASRKAELPIHFFICGDGALVDRLKGNVKQMRLENLSFLDFTNRDGVKELLNVTDASFICYKPLPILETGSPNKFFDGLSAGKLILINFGGWIRKEVEENNCGVYCDPNQPTDFVKKIKPFLSDKNLLLQYQQASRRLAENKYSRDLLSKKFVTLFR